VLVVRAVRLKLTELLVQTQFSGPFAQLAVVAVAVTENLDRQVVLVVAFLGTLLTVTHPLGVSPHRVSLVAHPLVLEKAAAVAVLLKPVILTALGRVVTALPPQLLVLLLLALVVAVPEVGQTLAVLVEMVAVVLAVMSTQITLLLERSTLVAVVGLVGLVVNLVRLGARESLSSSIPTQSL
jgi:hypothetical protein